LDAEDFAQGSYREATVRNQRDKWVVRIDRALKRA
jgi:hypothetical protein